jgi:glycosyltransferase involved in cell wall biosynthesis
VLHGKRATTTFIQRLPRARRSYKGYLPLMPVAVEQLDLSAYDLILSSSHAVAKGVLTGPAQLHVSYVHSPIRYAWDLQHQYLQEAGLIRGFKSMMARCIMHYMRLWDSRTASGVDRYLANSAYIGRRIRKVYGRPSTVVYPPVDLDAFMLSHAKEDFYLAASRMVPYKKMVLIVEAFSRMPDRQLVVIGDGSDMERVVKAAGPNVKVLGYQPFETLRDHMQRARAFVFAAEEDFGIAPVEAQACGTPVIAFGRGGVLETVAGLHCDEPTGVFYDQQTVESIEVGVREYEANAHRFTPDACRRNAEKFSIERFRVNYSRAIDAAIADWRREQEV